MYCIYCHRALKGFADSRVVVINRDRRPACIDIPACEARVAAAERAQREGAPQARK